MLRPCLLAFLLLTACHDPEDGTVEASLAVNGQTRSFLYHLPDGFAPDQKWPLVIVLHGRGGNGINAESGTHFTVLAKRQGFIAVYPDGIDRSWHDKRETGPAAEQNVDDIAFVSQLIDHEVAAHSVDPKRVYVTGMSNGGMMTYRLACELSDKITAVAPVIGLLPTNGADECHPTHPMPMEIFVGTEDPLVPYGGGDVADDRGTVLSAEATRAKFAGLAACQPIDVQATLDPDHDDDTRVFETGTTHCDRGVEVILWSVAGGGHTWPNGDQYLPKAAIGRVTHDIDAGEEMLRFFSRHGAQ